MNLLENLSSIQQLNINIDTKINASKDSREIANQLKSYICWSLDDYQKVQLMNILCDLNPNETEKSYWARSSIDIAKSKIETQEKSTKDVHIYVNSYNFITQNMYQLCDTIESMVYFELQRKSIETKKDNEGIHWKSMNTPEIAHQDIQ